VSECLSNFFNKCMTTGEFPDSWKIAHITPIPKVHSTSSISEYRPISVFPVLWKLFEKVLHRVYSYLTEHNPIDKRQYGFRENHSTELVITTIYELLRNFDNKLITCSLFLDLSKAFDCCDHEILLDKLYRYGIRGVSHKLFSNFLHIKMQCTKIGAFKSSYKRISGGVPQGSVISPLLFLIYINDIAKASLFHTALFADDINLHMSNSRFNVLQTTVNLELCNIDNWLRSNKLSLNYNKTNFMLLNSQKHNPASFKVIKNNHSISPVDKLKYLGVLLDNKLSWKPHVQKVKTQLSGACGVLAKLKYYTTQSVLKVVYNSLIHPYLNYSILNWGRASSATIQLLIKLQKKAIQIIKPTNTNCPEESFQHLNILSLPKIYTLSVGKFMHCYHNKLLLNHFDEYFIPLSSIHSQSTRLPTSNNPFLPRVNSSSGKCSLTFVGPKVWSSKPSDIKSSTTLTFKWKLKKHVLHEKDTQLWTFATFH